MSDEAGRAPENASDVIDDDLSVDRSLVRYAVAALGDRDALAVRDLLADLHPADVADLIEALPADAAGPFAGLAGDHLDPAVLAELGGDTREEVLGALKPQTIARALEALEADDAAFVLGDVDEEVRARVLQDVESEAREAVVSALAYDEESAGRLMQRAFYAAPRDRTVGDIIDHLRGDDTLPDDFYEIFVVDDDGRPVGSAALSRVLKSKRDVLVGDIMEPDPSVIRVDQDQEEVALLFDKYNLISAPVVDAEQRIVGAITVDDVVEVVQAEAQEDMFALAGVGEEGLSRRVVEIARSRFTWLAVNLVTAVLASAVIAQFEDAIAELVALAVLMPIVASMAGNAGTQTMTVAVRALATRELNALNGLRIVGRETLVGGLNGLAFALVVGLLAFVYYGDPGLGGVVALAMAFTLLAAGAAGILIPMALDRLGADPAVSSAVFVTTVTDVVGFGAFLGLASLVLL